MSEIRSILLHLDADAASAARLVFTQQLAQRHGAEVTVLFGGRSDAGQVASAYSAGAALQALEEGNSPVELERERLRTLSRMRKPECVWCDLVGDSIVHALVAEAAYADLLVVGQLARPGEIGGSPRGFAASVILQSGTPAIVVPHPLRRQAIGDCVLVAWNVSPPSARALKAALPFLKRANRVHIATWSRQPPAAPFSGLDVHGWLQRHGIGSDTHSRGPSSNVGAEAVALAAEVGADLVVMGCYGHSRIREQVFGGVTRELLATLSVPMLMAH